MKSANRRRLPAKYGERAQTAAAWAQAESKRAKVMKVMTSNN